ncbi:MAG: hypothetical protein JOZ08_09310 [Verrucomicrobia bacterium]|nr:hypothetical protein [Verrucomicrobiota bacterium]
MTYVYILRSIDHPDQFYIGWTEGLRDRVAAHRVSGGTQSSSVAMPYPALCREELGFVSGEFA